MRLSTYPSIEDVYRDMLASTIPAAAKRTVRNCLRVAERHFDLGRTVEGHRELDRARALLHWEERCKRADA